MNSWHELTLGDAAAALPTLKNIQLTFRTAARAIDAAVFQRDALPHEPVLVYFSPGVADIASMFAARSCAKPPWGSGLSLVVGDQRAMSIHYPAHGNGRP